MGQFSVQFSTQVNGKVRQYPHNLKGQQHAVKGADRGAVEALRAGQVDGKDIKMTQKVAKNVAAQLSDGNRISAYEKPVYFAAIQAAKGNEVFVTDATGHWRKLETTSAGAAALFAGVKGIRIAKN